MNKHNSPTSTTNRLHFTDLAPARFEDLCLNLMYRLHAWKEIRHYGRTGTDGGIDILAVNVLEDGTPENWYIQCRRYAKASKATLIQAVNDVLATADALPDVVLVVLACDVQRSSHEAFIQYAYEQGVNRPLLWTQSILEARLYSDRPDLLGVYFGIGKSGRQTESARSGERGVRHKLVLKEKMYRDFVRKDVEPAVVRKAPWAKFKVGEAIIRSVDDRSYPNIDETGARPSTWFKVELFNFYHNGLGVIASVHKGIVDKEGRWSIIGYDQEYDASLYREENIIQVGQIPYAEIANYDVDGDEYYNIPHIYCRFQSLHGPYESYKYVLSTQEYHWALDDKLRIGRKP